MKNKSTRFPFPIDFKFLLSKIFLAIIAIFFLILSYTVSAGQRNERLSQLEKNLQNFSLNLSEQAKSDFRDIHLSLFQIANQNNEIDSEAWGKSVKALLQNVQEIETITWKDKESFNFQAMQKTVKMENQNFILTEIQGKVTEILPISKNNQIQGYLIATFNLENLFKQYEIQSKNDFMFQLSNEEQVLFSSKNWENIENSLQFSQLFKIHQRSDLALVSSPTKLLISSIQTQYIKTQIETLLACFLTFLAILFAQRYYRNSKMNESRFHTLLDEVALATVILDIQGNVTYCNDYFLSKTQWKLEEALGKNYFTTFIPPSFLPETMKVYDAVTQGINQASSEIPLLTKTGEILWFILNITILRNTKGAIVGATGVGEDITERKQNEKMLLTQFEFTETLFAIDQAITARKSMDETLSFILDKTRKHLEVDAAAILIFNPHSQCLEYKASNGFKTPLIKQVCIPLGNGIAGKAALEKKEMWNCELSRTAIDPTHSKIIEDEQFLCYRVVPLLINGKTNGVLEVFSLKQVECNETKANFLKALAQQTAIAIDNLTLFSNLQKSNTELFQAYESTIEGWSHALDLRDKETENHSLRVTEMTERICRSAGMSSSSLIQVRRGALLHDIGKMGIPDSILLKVAKLTDEEWAIIKKHPVHAFELLSPIEYLRPALDIPYCHHEKWDGSGYPRGLKEDQIPFAARIFAVVDVWDALLSDRPYRKGWPEDRVYDFLKSLSGTHFDPKAVELFFDVLDQK
jgi:PAS domain S-box-containing protein/putative nucleotidyltransferase with HDIG domain